MKKMELDERYLGIVVQKVIEKGYKGQVTVDMVFCEHIVDTLPIPLNVARGEKLHQFLEKKLDGYSFAIGQKSKEVIEKLVKSEAEMGSSIDLREQPTIDEVLSKIREMTSDAKFKDRLYIRNGAIFMVSKKAELQKLLSEMGIEGWTELDLKRQAKRLGLLEVSAGRSYEFKSYSYRNGQGSEGRWMLKFPLKSLDEFFSGLKRTGDQQANRVEEKVAGLADVPVADTGDGEPDGRTGQMYGQDLLSKEPETCHVEIDP